MAEARNRSFYIGVAQGARLAAGGPGRPPGLARGFFVRPTVFVDVRPEMTIAREEIFGPVLSILAYENEDDAARRSAATSSQATAGNGANSA